MAAKFGLYVDRTIIIHPTILVSIMDHFPAGKDFGTSTPMTLYQVEDVYTQIPGMLQIMGTSWEVRI